MTFRWVVQWARKKARMRTENRGLATEAIGVYRWREDETKAGCRRAEVGKRKKRERNREREKEREKRGGDDDTVEETNHDSSIKKIH